MPLVVDENIHYRMLKFMHAQSSAAYDVRLWLRDLPVLYGVWHPYKYCVLAVYRTFFPIFALLETTSPLIGKEIGGTRKVLHIEKLVACLLLLRHKISSRAKAALQDFNASAKTRIGSSNNLLTFYKTKSLALFMGIRCSCSR